MLNQYRYGVNCHNALAYLDVMGGGCLGLFLFLFAVSAKKKSHGHTHLGLSWFPRI